MDDSKRATKQSKVTIALLVAALVVFVVHAVLTNAQIRSVRAELRELAKEDSGRAVPPRTAISTSSLVGTGVPVAPRFADSGGGAETGSAQNLTLDRQPTAEVGGQSADEDPWLPVLEETFEQDKAAGRIEDSRALDATLAAAIGENGRVVESECRSSICRAVFEISTHEALAQAVRAIGAGEAAWRGAFSIRKSTESNGSIRALAFFAPPGEELPQPY